ncbi:MAG: 30S ribosomal protein S4 [Candidatus Zixiibacteriota bacterium]
MARYTGPVCRHCRREGKKLFLKGDRCYTDKCSFARRETPPGARLYSFSRRRMSEYGIRLREKQKLRRFYGMQEKQFRNTFKKANKMKGNTGENFLKLLETRLDNIVYRMGFAPSRRSARQLILHRHFHVNGKLVNVPSFVVKPGDIVSVKPGSNKLDIVHLALRKKGRVEDLSWFEVNKAKLEGKVLNIPARADIPVDINELYVVEYYSK